MSLYDPSDGVILHTFPPHASTVTDLAFSPDGERLVTASDDSTMRVWSVSDHELLQEYATPPGGYWSMVFAGDGRSLVVSDVVGVISVIDVEDGSVLRTFAGQKNRLAELAISHDGSLVAVLAVTTIPSNFVHRDRRARDSAAGTHSTRADGGVLGRRRAARVGIQRRHRAAVGAPGNFLSYS